MRWLTILLLLLAGPALAVDPDCVNPSDFDDWDGRDGSFAFCTPANVPTVCTTIFDGAVYQPGGFPLLSTDPLAAPGTRVDFTIPADWTGTGTYAIRCANANQQTSERSGIATFRDVPLPFPEPARTL